MGSGGSWVASNADKYGGIHGELLAIGPTPRPVGRHLILTSLHTCSSALFFGGSICIYAPVANSYLNFTNLAPTCSSHLNRDLPMTGYHSTLTRRSKSPVKMAMKRSEPSDQCCCGEQEGDGIARSILVTMLKPAKVGTRDDKSAWK